MNRHNEAVRDIYATVMQDPSQWTVWSPTFWEHVSRVTPLDVAALRLRAILELMNPVAYRAGYYAAQFSPGLLYALTTGDEAAVKEFHRWLDRWLVPSARVDMSANGATEGGILISSRVCFPVYSPRSSTAWAEAVSTVASAICSGAETHADLLRSTSIHTANRTGVGGLTATLVTASITYQSIPDSTDRGHVGSAGMIRFDLTAVEGQTLVYPACSADVVQLGRVAREKTLLIP